MTTAVIDPVSDYLGKNQFEILSVAGHQLSDLERVLIGYVASVENPGELNTSAAAPRQVSFQEAYHVSFEHLRRTEPDSIFYFIRGITSSLLNEMRVRTSRALEPSEQVQLTSEVTRKFLEMYENGSWRNLDYTQLIDTGINKVLTQNPFTYHVRKTLKGLENKQIISIEGRGDNAKILLNQAVDPAELYRKL